MAQAYKVLAQTVVVANTDTTLYTVPAATETVVSTIKVCNVGAVARVFRVAIRLNGVAVANQMYLEFDQALPANDSYKVPGTYTLQITGGADIILVRADHADVVFSCYGTEIT